MRGEAGKLPVEVEQKQSEQSTVRVTRSKRKHSATVSSKTFSWADIRLPALTRLHLQISVRSSYIGAASFLAAHTALLELDVTTTVVSVRRLTAVLRDPAALPQLARFRLVDPLDGIRQNLVPMVTALAMTRTAATGEPRQLEELTFKVPTTHEVFTAAALMPGLTRLHVNPVPSG